MYVSLDLLQELAKTHDTAYVA